VYSSELKGVKPRDFCDLSCTSVIVLPATDGSPLPAGRTRRIGRGNLEIRDVVSRDSGLYQCLLDGVPETVAEALLSVIGE